MGGFLVAHHRRVQGRHCLGLDALHPPVHCQGAPWWPSAGGIFAGLLSPRQGLACEPGGPPRAGRAGRVSRPGQPGAAGSLAQRGLGRPASSVQGECLACLHASTASNGCEGCGQALGPCSAWDLNRLESRQSLEAGQLSCDGGQDTLIEGLTLTSCWRACPQTEVQALTRSLC